MHVQFIEPTEEQQEAWEEKKVAREERRAEAREAETGSVTIGKLGNAETRLFRQRPLVDWATDWMTRNRA